MGPDLIAYDIIYLILKDFLKSKLTVRMVLLHDTLSNKLRLLGLLSDGDRIAIYFPNTVDQDWFRQTPFDTTTINECLDEKIISFILSEIQIDDHSISLDYKEMPNKIDILVKGET